MMLEILRWLSFVWLTAMAWAFITEWVLPRVRSRKKAARGG